MKFSYTIILALVACANAIAFDSGEHYPYAFGIRRGNEVLGEDAQKVENVSSRKVRKTKDTRAVKEVANKSEKDRQEAFEHAEEAALYAVGDEVSLLYHKLLRRDMQEVKDKKRTTKPKAILVKNEKEPVEDDFEKAQEAVFNAVEAAEKKALHVVEDVEKAVVHAVEEEVDLLFHDLPHHEKEAVEVSEKKPKKSKKPKHEEEEHHSRLERCLDENKKASLIECMEGMIE